MYHLTETEQNIVFHDEPGWFWLFGLSFVIFGILLLVVSLTGILGEFVQFALPVQMVMTMLGVSGIVVGGLVINHTPLSRVIYDKTRSTLTIARNKLILNQVSKFSLNEIAVVFADQSLNNETGVLYRPVMKLRNGKSIPISSLWSRSRGEVDTVIHAFGSVIAKTGAVDLYIQ